MKTVIEMAREAGFVEDDFYKDIYEGNAQDFERFAALVREEVYKQDDMTTAYMVGYQAGVDDERARGRK